MRKVTIALPKDLNRKEVLERVSMAITIASHVYGKPKTLLWFSHKIEAKKLIIEFDGQTGEFIATLVVAFLTQPNDSDEQIIQG